jgi:lipopolysaccharide export system permease protein
MNKIVPFALFFSFSYVLSKYELNNELIVFWTHGITKLQIINLFLKFSIFLVVIQILLSSFVVPKSQELSRDFLKESNIDFFDNFIKPKKFNDTIKNLTIYADGKDAQGFLVNIYMKKGSFQNFQITYAKRGKYNFINGVKFLTLYDGNTINNTDSGISNFSFSKSDFNLSDLETNTITTIKTQETSTVELINCIKNFFNGNLQNKNSSAITQNCNLRNLDNVYKELYKRHIIPLYIPILILLSMVHIIRSKEKINFSKYRVSIFILGLLTIIFSETTS